MANTQFNSVDGYSVGNASIVIDANRNVSGNLITATANVTAPQLISNVAIGTAPFVVTSTTQVANLNVATAGTAGSATTSGTVTTAAQPNITSVGTLTSLNSSGTITAPAFTANTGVFTGNGSGLTALNGSNITTGTIAAARVATLNQNTTGSAATVTTAAQPNITSVGTLSALTVSGNVNIDSDTLFVDSVNNEVGIGTTFPNARLHVQGTGNKLLLADNDGGNLLITVNDEEASLYVTDSGIPITFSTSAVQRMVISDTGNVGIGNANPAHRLSVTGTLNVSGNANVGNIGATGAVFTTIAGSLTTAAQPNITSVGTLTSLSVTGNITSGNFVGRLANGNSNVNIATSGGNITMSVGGTANVVTVTSSNVQIGTGSGGNISGANVVTANVFISSVATGVSAAGTVQSNATALTSQITVVSTVASGAGVRLPTAIAGMRITVINTSANTLNVYPLGNGIINSQAANVAYSQPAGSRLDFICTAAATAPGGQWYTLNATYG